MTRAVVSTAGAAFAVLGLTAGASDAARPTLAGEATHGEAGGDILVHYATTGVDAPPTDDANGNGVPELVESVAAEAELALDHFVSLGFRRPLDDGALGGDGRIDVYLRDLQAADGNASTDSCTGERCVGYVSAENDYAGFGYPSRLEGIRSVVPHELFHLVQNAYSSDQSATWTEGSAVWAVDHLYADANSDFERFLPTFIARSYRPFERPVAGFGDGYPYGAALWPYFLEHRFGVDAVVDAWTACEQSPFLDATETALVPLGSSVDEAWSDFTRANVFTGSRAALGDYPDAASWREVPREPMIELEGTAYVEGLSARYVPIRAERRSELTIAAPPGFAYAAWVIADGAHLESGVALVRTAGGGLAATIDAGGYTLVVTGLERGSIATALDVRLADPPEETGCSAGGHPLDLAALLLFVGIPLGRRRPSRLAKEEA